MSSKMSCYQISKLAGVTESQLSLFVNRKRTLTLSSAAKVAEVLGLELTPRKKGR
jgi:plasmid maintenance system antidote protein VapI